jgi:hypothetical protein
MVARQAFLEAVRVEIDPAAIGVDFRSAALGQQRGGFRETHGLRHRQRWGSDQNNQQNGNNAEHGVI